MIAGRFFFEISPDKILYMEGPWFPAPSEEEWEISIMPFKPLEGVSPSFLNAKLAKIITREELSQCGNSTSRLSLQWNVSNRSLFSTSFTKLQTLIAQKLAIKGVPWASQSAPLKEAPQYWDGLVQKSKNVSKSLHLYGAELKNESVVGATPEWLFRIEEGGKELHTLALAGTRWSGQERLAAQEKKDAREHQLVVDDIVEKLKPFGLVTVKDRTWINAGSVEHLHTPIHLVSKSVLDVQELLRVLHPTPAVGVFPRTKEALKWQNELPGHEQRADFAAPWVVRNRKDGRAWALVALRQIRLRPDHIFIPAGCGVIADSVEEVEWKEIQEKIQSVKEAWDLPV